MILAISGISLSDLKLRWEHTEDRLHRQALRRALLE